VQDHPEIALLLLKQAREIDLIALFHRREYQLLIRNLKGQMLSAALNGINNGSLNIGTGSRSRNEGSLFNGASSLPVLGSEFSGESVNAVSTLMQSSQVQYHNPSISNPGTTCNSVNNLASQLCNPVSNGSNQIPQTMFSGPGSSSIAAGFNSFTNPLHQNNPKGSPIINSQQCISGAIHQTGLANMSYHHSGNNINNQSNGSNVNSQLNNTNINSQLSGIGITIVIAVVSGLITGKLLPIFGRKAEAYEDAEEFME
jgi:hypothetical protein